jgi:hypothetical protein
MKNVWLKRNQLQRKPKADSKQIWAQYRKFKENCKRQLFDLAHGQVLFYYSPWIITEQVTAM